MVYERSRRYATGEMTAEILKGPTNRERNLRDGASTNEARLRFFVERRTWSPIENCTSRWCLSYCVACIVRAFSRLSLTFSIISEIFSVFVVASGLLVA